MKYTIIILLFSLNSFAQDSAKLYHKNFTLQTREAEALVSILASGNEVLEDLYTALSSKYKVNAPALNATITIDSVRNDALIAIGSHIRNLPYPLVQNIYAKIDAAIRQSPYVNNYFRVMDEGVNELLQQQRGEARRRLKGIRL